MFDEYKQFLKYDGKSENTIKRYDYLLNRFSSEAGKRPDEATAEDIRSIAETIW